MRIFEFFKNVFLVKLQQGEDGPKLVFAAKVDCSNMGLISLPDVLPLATITLNVSNNNVNINSFFYYVHVNYLEPICLTQFLLFADNKLIDDGEQSHLRPFGPADRR